ncbi:MAG TPA: hypothetical protein VH600_05850, partial [Burkholderiales bacterium]
HPSAPLLLDIQQQLGIVQANLAILLDDRGRASEQRAKIYEKLAELSSRLLRVEGLTPRVEKLERLLEALERDRQRIMGAAHVAGWLGRGGYVVLGVVLSASMWIIDHVFFRR